MRATQPRTSRYDSRDVAAEPLRHQHDQRQHREGDQRQPPVHPQHDADDADQHERVAEHRDHAGREQLVERVDVARDARHQPADRVAIVVGHVEPLQVAVDRHPHVEHDALADHLRDPGLRELEHEDAGEHGQEQQPRPRPTPARSPRAMCSSIATLVSHGCTSCSSDVGDDDDQAEPARCASAAAGSPAAAASGGRRRPCR